jgi:transcriptional regulator with XRE-family HTH domain
MNRRAYLRTLRVRRDLTQAQLADMSGIAQNTISKLETHIATPSFATVVAIARALKVDPLEIRFGPEPSIRRPGRQAAAADADKRESVRVSD